MRISGLLRQRDFLRPSCCADSLNANGLQPLTGQKPDPACSRMKQNFITGLKRDRLGQKISDRHPL